MRRAMPRACERAGIAYGMGLDDGAVFHIIRHSTTTELIVNQKQPIPTVMKITGHSSLKTMMRYIHPTPAVIEEALESGQIDLSMFEI
jgi:integrase